ncbi:hypothetical protein B0H11DRAFT_1930783 [Mycena galericulata]|nr:hypothetical protein B0H11DRAFT_1930783 [Mycena galericulata]
MSTSFTDENIDPALLAMYPTNTAQIAPPPKSPPRNDDLNDKQAGPSRPPDAPAQTAPPLVAYGRLVKHKMNLSDSLQKKRGFWAPDYDSETRCISSRISSVDTYQEQYQAARNKSIRSSIRNTEIVSDTRGFGAVEMNAEMTRFGNKISLSKTFHISQFCEMRCAEERQALLFAHVLQLLELSNKNEKAKPWIITPDVAKKIGSYVKAFVFSPTTTSYRDLNVSEHISKAIRQCKVKGLPEEDDTVAVDLDDVFWPKVDETIAKFRKDSNNQDEFNLRQRGSWAPAKTDFKTVESEGVPGWQATLHKHAGNVQPMPKAAGGPPQKKRRVEQLENSSDGG